MTTLSLAAMARMSEQDTTPGQAFSPPSMTSKPLTEPLLGFRHLLALEALRVVQQQRRVATLHSTVFVVSRRVYPRWLILYLVAN
jgi:hypothetical protein